MPKNYTYYRILALVVTLFFLFCAAISKNFGPKPVTAKHNIEKIREEHFPSENMTTSELMPEEEMKKIWEEHIKLEQRINFVCSTAILCSIFMYIYMKT